MSAPNVVSLDFGNFESGGMVSKQNVRVKESRFVIWQYPTGTTGPGIFVKLSMDLLSSPGGEVIGEGDQMLSFGKMEYFTIAEDGKTCIPGAKGAPQQKTAFHQFMGTLIAAGMPANWMANGDISRLEGTEFYADSIKVKRIDGEGDSNQFVCSPGSIHHAPWDKAGSGAGVAKARTKTAAVAGATAPTPAATHPTGAVATAPTAPSADPSEAETNAVSFMQQFLSDSTNPPLKTVTCMVQMSKKFSADPSWPSAMSAMKTPAAVRAIVGANDEMVVLVGEGASQVIQLPA